MSDVLVSSPVHLRNTTLSPQVELGLHGGGSWYWEPLSAESASLIFACYLAKFSKFDCFSIWASGEWKAIQCWTVERGQERSMCVGKIWTSLRVGREGEIFGTSSSLSHLSEEKQGWSLLRSKPCLSLLFRVRGIEPRALCISGRHSTSEPQPKCFSASLSFLRRFQSAAQAGIELTVVA